MSKKCIRKVSGVGRINILKFILLISIVHLIVVRTEHTVLQPILGLLNIDLHVLTWQIGRSAVSSVPENASASATMQRQSAPAPTDLTSSSDKLIAVSCASARQPRASYSQL